MFSMPFDVPSMILCPKFSNILLRLVKKKICNLNREIEIFAMSGKVRNCIRNVAVNLFESH